MSDDSEQEKEVPKSSSFSKLLFNRKQTSQVQFPIHDTDDLLIDNIVDDDNLINFKSLSTSQLVLSEERSDFETDKLTNNVSV